MEGPILQGILFNITKQLTKTLKEGLFFLILKIVSVHHDEEATGRSVRSLSLESIMVGKERGWNVFIPVISSCHCMKRMDAGMALALEVGI